MSASVADTQVRTYLDAVKAHLDDLPDADRDELLEDLEEHLLEVAAEDDGTLEQRLGPPESYAEELRASAGLPSREQMLARRPAQRVADRLARSTAWRAVARMNESPIPREVHGFLKELGPGWWVLRGYLAVAVTAMITSGNRRDNFPFPRIAGSYFTGSVLTILAVVVSVWLGRRVRRGRKGRAYSILLSVAVAAGTLAAMGGWETGYTDAYYDTPSPIEAAPYLHHADGNPIANVCPYSSDGKLLSGVLLFDQGGRAIVDTARVTLPDGRPVERSQPAILNAYPQALFTLNDIGQPVPLTCPPSIGAPAGPAPAPSPGG